jgi:hypothetical protein
MAASFLTAAQRDRYGRYPDVVTPEDLSRCFHLSDDRAQIMSCRGDYLGFNNAKQGGANLAIDEYRTFVLQGKGGVGKSYAAVLFAQYLRERGLPVSCFDGDPLNQTLGGFAALDVKKVDFLENTEKGRRINPRRFDDLVEEIANQPAGSHIIVDTGSSAFVALVHHLVAHEASR